MNRLYLVTAGALVFTAATLMRNASARTVRVVGSIAVVGVTWSLVQARHFALFAEQQQRDPSPLTADLKTENTPITRFAYLVFPSPPSTFTHGVTDPVLEHRILGNDNQVLLDLGEVALKSAVSLTVSALEPNDPAAPTYHHLAQPLQLTPGHHYLHRWEMPAGKPEGLIEYHGDDFLRKYQLPEYGGAESFGAGDRHRDWIALWTTSTSPQQIDARFFPLSGASSAAPRLTAQLLEYQPDDLPVKVVSWAPYRVRVDSPADAWLETPRMYQEAYRASIGDAKVPVKKSPRGLVAVKIPAGASEVRIWFRPPWALAIAHATSLLSLLAAAVGAAVFLLLRFTRLSFAEDPS